MTLKNTILMALMVAILGAAVIMVLFVTDTISKQNMIEALSKGGWVLLILTLAMALIRLVRQAGQK